jgi:DNA-binding transcriptional LysR family regulator
VLPLMPAFMARYPALTLDVNVENRRVDLVAGGFDAAIGGGFDLAPGVVARELMPAHAVLVASPDYLAARKPPVTPADLADFDAIVMRSPQSGRAKSWEMRNRGGDGMQAMPRPRVFLNDPDAIRAAALMGMGVALLVTTDLGTHLESGALQRVLPDWYVDVGAISLYFTSQKLMPAKTRAFVDFMTEAFREQKMAERYSAV